MAAPPDKSLSDCRLVMNRAMESKNGLEITFKNEKSCLMFRHRCYSTRIRDRKQTARVYEFGHPEYGKSPYDSLAFIVEEVEGDNFLGGLAARKTIWKLHITKSDSPFGALTIEEKK